MGEELPLPQNMPERHSGQHQTFGERLVSPDVYGEQKSAETNSSPEAKTNASGTNNPVNSNVDENTTSNNSRVVPSITDDTMTTVLDDVPMIAADDDLIEKQWVDATKKIVSQTKSDPYAQARAVGKLQADYLSKRYGKIVKIKEDVL